MEERIDITIDPRVYLALLSRDIGGHISDFRNTLRTIEDESFVTRSKQKPPGMMIHIQASDAGLGRDEASKRAIDNCFLAMTRALINFVDRILALKKASDTQVGQLTEGEDWRPLIENHIEKCYRKIAEDTSLTNPKKVEMLQGLDEWIRDSMLAMFGIRRALEHHGGVSKNDIHLGVRRMILSVGDQELTNVPMEIKGGGTLSMQIVEKDIHIQANTAIPLTEEDIEYTFFTLQSIVGPAILKTLAPKSTNA